MPCRCDGSRSGLAARGGKCGGEQQGRGLAGVFLTGSTPLAALPQIVGRAYVACNVVASSSPLHSPTVEWMVDVRWPSCSLCSCLIRSTSDYWRADPRTFWLTYSRNHDPRSMISRHDFLQNTRADRTYSLCLKKSDESTLWQNYPASCYVSLIMFGKQL